MGFKDALNNIKNYMSPYAEDEESGEEDAIFTRRADERDKLNVEMPGDSRRNKVLNIHATTQLAVVLVKPERFDNAAEIADHLREKRTVVLNLEGMHRDPARRLLDFLVGAAYINDGKIKKVANATYIITPFNVEIMGDLIDELENNGFFYHNSAD